MLEQEVESKFADHNNRLKDFGMINFSIKNLYFTYNERTSNTSAWSANCSGKGGKTLKLEDDGNLVVYDAANKAIWSSGTNGK